MTEAVEPDVLLQKIAMPGWRGVQFRSDAAKRFAIYAVDHWRGTPERSEAPVVVKPRAADLYDLASQLARGRTFWTIAAVVVTLAAAISGSAVVIALMAVAWVGWLVVFVGAGLVRAATETAATEYRERAEAASKVERRMAAPQLSWKKMRCLSDMLTTTEGKLVYAATVLAAETELSPAWGDELFDTFHARVDLRRHVGEIADSASALDQARKELGPRPGGALARDDTLTELYDRRARELDDRVLALTRRVHGLLIYRDRVRGFEPLIEKRKWIEKLQHAPHGEAPTNDDLGAAELRSATDEVDGRTREAMTFLLEDAERLSKLL